MAKVSKKAAKAAEKKAPVAKPEAEKVTTAWNKGITMELHAVKVAGKVYKSTWQAWQALNAGSRGQCIRFRKELKKKGKLVWQTPAGKKIEFVTVKPEPV
jgi:hypothetical protein